MKLEKKEYICDICKQIFLRRRYFVQHFRRHTQGVDKNKNENAASLTDLLPKNWKYVTKSYEPVQNKNFTATVLVFELCSSDQVKEWMKEFMNINKCNYILKHLDTRESRFAKSKHVYMCRYLNRRSNKSSCQSCIRIVIRRNWENSAYFAVVNIKYVHNHSPDCAAILRYRSPSEEVQEYFRTMFENGFSPSQAYNSYKQHLYVQYSSKYDSVIADRSICPDQRWVYYFYQKILKQKIGPTPTEQMITTAKNSVDECNTSYNDTIFHFEQVGDSDFVVVAMTLLMRRASHLPYAAEMILVNYESEVSRFNLHVYLIFTACSAGGIPIGVIVTSSNSDSVLSAGFRLYRRVLDERSFEGRSAPKIIMTDNCLGLKPALENVFSSSYIFLSIFQILESGWKWLWKVENGIDSKFRKSFYNYLQRMMYCTQPELLDIIFADLLSDGNVEKHKNFVDYATDLYSHRTEWALCLQEKLPVEKSDIKNIIEKSMTVFKEKIFKKLRSYNPAQLFHYIVNSFNQFYEQKLIDVVVNENYNYVNQHTNISPEQLSKYKMEYITESVIMLANTKKNVHYVINKDIGVCSCYLGEAGLACKHLAVLNYYFNQTNQTDYSITDEEKKQFYYVAVGMPYATENQNSIMDTEPTPIIEDFVDTDYNSDVIEEEVVVVLDDDDDVRFVQVSDFDVDKSIEEVKNNFSVLLDKMKTNVPLFGDTIVKMNEKLRSLAEQKDNVVYSALSNFIQDD